MPVDLLQIQRYDLAKGMQLVAGWVMVVSVVALVFGARSQYRLMNAYDVLSFQISSGEQRARTILSHVKRLVFSVLATKERGARSAMSTLRNRDTRPGAWLRGPAVASACQCCGHSARPRRMARIVWALLRRGPRCASLMAIVQIGGVPEIALVLGVSEATARTHLQHVFEKTGVSRQADLVKIVAGFMSPLTG